MIAVLMAEKKRWPESQGIVKLRPAVPVVQGSWGIKTVPEGRRYV
jgi:hypothetical protein